VHKQSQDRLRNAKATFWEMSVLEHPEWKQTAIKPGFYRQGETSAAQASHSPHALWPKAASSDDLKALTLDIGLIEAGRHSSAKVAQEEGSLYKAGCYFTPKTTASKESIVERHFSFGEDLKGGVSKLTGAEEGLRLTEMVRTGSKSPHLTVSSQQLPCDALCPLEEAVEALVVPRIFLPAKKSPQLLNPKETSASLPKDSQDHKLKPPYTKPKLFRTPTFGLPKRLSRSPEDFVPVPKPAGPSSRSKNTRLVEVKANCNAIEDLACPRSADSSESSSQSFESV
jgi:hypothetical protein